MFGPGGSDIGALRGDLRPGAEVELGEDVRDVALDRPRRDLQPPGRHSRRSTQRSGRDPTGRAGPGSAGPHQQEDEERVAAARSRTAETRCPAGGVVDAQQDRPRLAPGFHLCAGEVSRVGAVRRGASSCDHCEAVPQAAVVPTRAGHHVAGDEGIGRQPVQQDTAGTVGTQVWYRPGSTDRGLDVSGSAGGPPATRTRAARSAAARAADSASWRRPPRRSGPSRAVR